MTLQEYLDSCANVDRKGNRHAKLYRAPLRFVPSETPAALVPVDPYYLGMWLGDGYKCNALISGSDQETKAYIQAYVDRLNSTKPSGEPPLRLQESHVKKPGDVSILSNPDGTTETITATMDCFNWKISSTAKGPKTWNPVSHGLRRLGFTGEDKSVGIPACYMNADEDTRLAVLAGLIDSDGSLWGGYYMFSQMTYEHKKIVDDAHKLAVSCGIACSPVRQILIKKRLDEPRWQFYLYKGSEKFQHHLLMPRKKLNGIKPGGMTVNFDAHVFHVSEEYEQECRAVSISGNLFQLANRTVVHD
jgi:hypothetical protein